MIGEIRDTETARIAIQAAMTGHLVLSTLHPTTSTAALTRVADMGIDKFLITSTLIGVLAQRLVRRLCPSCKTAVPLSNEEADDLGIAHNLTISQPKGCAACHHTGYQGRIAIGEFFILDDLLRPQIKNVDNDFELREVMRKRGMKFLSNQLIDLLLDHTTGLDEIIRVGVKEA